jgi:hypothetical protein
VHDPVDWDPAWQAMRLPSAATYLHQQILVMFLFKS